jgi:hypothetical protein
MGDEIRTRFPGTGQLVPRQKPETGPERVPSQAATALSAATYS